MENQVVSSSPASSAGIPVAPTPWPIWLVMGICVFVVLSAGLNAWQQYEVLSVLSMFGGAPASTWALLAVSLALALCAWGVLVRLWFRRSLRLALAFVMAVFLASILRLALSFEALDLDFLLQLVWLAGLAALFRGLLMRLRLAALSTQ